MDADTFLTIAAYQGPIIEGNQARSTARAIELVERAEAKNVDILCLPEAYLHGYFPTRELALTHSLDLQSPAFDTLCQQFAHFKRTTLLLGLNEREGEALYNTVVVIENGACLGKYRKAYTYSPYHYYSVGREFPVFEKKGVKYGIIICVDSNFREPALITALNGARLLFCPMLNRVPQDAHMLLYLQRKNHFIARAYDNQCWLAASDIIYDGPEETCPGYACILNDNGDILVQSEPFQEDMLSYSIPLKNLMEVRKHQLFGAPDLFAILTKSYLAAHKT
ncbi:MAG: hypothetical protein A3E85_00005 [Gammaproteobacteria bacterium RIFCSPHIGHO2_12_FULL_45_12]|nr:MAG: hypothetical protein A3E85_00005 [Gammaproteobacteria bacterium RIFCSPHIGHO2_12_FULL_45_12]